MVKGITEEDFEFIQKEDNFNKAIILNISTNFPVSLSMQSRKQ
jgi:hypothetical protein